MAFESAVNDEVEVDETDVVEVDVEVTDELDDEVVLAHENWRQSRIIATKAPKLAISYDSE